MIVETVLNLIVTLVLGIVGLFPALPSIPTDFMDDVVQVFSLIDLFVSLRVVSVCLVAIFVLINARVIWSVIMWVVRKIPGVE